MLRERFSAPLDPSALNLSASVGEDERLLPQDLFGSLAHVAMLGRVGLLSPASAAKIARGLRAIGRDAQAGRFRLDPNLEDVHINVESELTKRIGRDGERLHTGRSRNDQVATDIALYLRDALLALETASAISARTLIERARGPEGRGVVAAWTHLQPAQRVYVAQLLGSHALRFARDVERFQSVRLTLDLSPLGSGAIAGSSLPLDRALSARLMGFAGPSLSSVDSVSDRDAVASTLFALSLLQVHASALGEEIVIGSMPEVARVSLADAFVTSSSLMPHKRNPDLAELLRAEAAPAVGRLVSHLVMQKGLPIGYQRDLQVGKPLLFEGVERALATLAVLSAMVRTATFRAPPPTPHEPTWSVELADALVEAGVPFREAHARVARFLSSAVGRESPVTPAALHREFPEIRPGGFRPPSASEEPERRRTRGGSSWKEVDRLLTHLESRVRIAGRKTERETQRLRRLRQKIGAPEPWTLGSLRRPAGRPVRSTPRRARRARRRGP
ncbi:MAG: argininosuccinate lyase [Candidatus Lutacidiplasmatales archaeon]